MQRENRGRGNRGGKNDNRDRDDRRDMPGQPQRSNQCELLVNHFKLTAQNVHAYLIDWGANIPQDNKDLQSQAKSSCKMQLKELFGNFIFMRNNGFDYVLSAQKPESELEINVNVEGLSTSINLQYKKSIDLNNLKKDDLDQIRSCKFYLTKVLKMFLQQENFDQLGLNPKFFDKQDKKPVQPYNCTFEDKVDYWRGYQVANFQFSGGIFLNVDSCTKFLLGSSIYEQYKAEKDKKKFISKFDSSLRDEFEQGETVLARHNSKIYQVDKFLADANPSKMFDSKGGKISVGQYFQDKYNITLKKDEPLLMINRYKNDDEADISNVIYLPTSECFTAQLPDQYTSNRKYATELANYKITPQERLNLIEKFVKKLNNSKEIESWGIKFQNQINKVQAQIYNEPQIIIQNGHKPINDFYFRNVGPSEQLSINSDEVVFLYNDTKDEYDIAGWVQQMLVKAAQGLNMNFAQDNKDFNYYSIIDQRDFQKDYKDDKDKKLKGRHMLAVMKIPREIQMKNKIVIVLLNDSKEKALVKRSLEKLGIVSQFLLVNTMNQLYKKPQNTQLGAFSNILRQIQAKKKKDLYRIKVDKQIASDKISTMFVGIDVVVKNGKKVVGLAASSSKHVTQHFCKVSYQENRKKGNLKKVELDRQICEERTKIVFDFVIDALKNWREINNDQGPSQIVVYRDAVGGPIYKENLLELETESELKNAIQQFDSSYDPKILYILVDKNNMTRFFKDSKNPEQMNPEPGTVVQKDIVFKDGDKQFDFYMVANKNPRQASARPVHYQVEINTTNLTKEQIIEMTYHQCYNYYGFGGPIKTPATAYYAQKIAKYVVDNYVIDCKSVLDQVRPSLLNNLHFL